MKALGSLKLESMEAEVEGLGSLYTARLFVDDRISI